jgi:hydroxymethylbilane synthase
VTTVLIATRRSDLALWQARWVAARIESVLGAATELVPLTTTGDRLLGSLAKVGGKGLFVKEVEEALLERRADVAVHSAKDLPAALRAELDLVAFPERADPRDALVARERGAQLDDLPRGARVGTGSVRRSAQLLRHRPDLEVVPLRGNVPTRLSKLESEALDAVVLACSGLERLSLGERIDERVDTGVLLPAVAQGALAIEARRGDPLARDLAALDHAPTAACVRVERSFLSELEGDCNVPLAALAETGADGELRVRGMVIAPDGRRVAAAEARVEARHASRGGRALAREVLDRGGAEILAALSTGSAA